MKKLELDQHKFKNKGYPYPHEMLIEWFVISMPLAQADQLEKFRGGGQSRMRPKIWQVSQEKSIFYMVADINTLYESNELPGYIYIKIVRWN